MAIISSIGLWLLEQAGGTVFNLATQRLLQSMGLDSLLLPSETKSLLDEYLQRLVGRLDEDRIAKLYGGFSQVRDSSKTTAKQGLLEQALDRFHDVSNLPQQGITGGYQNAQLRCLAFLGMATAHTILNDSQELIAEKIIEAVYADSSTAQQFLGKSIVRPLLAYKDHILIGHIQGVRDIVFSPDGETLVSGGEDNTLRLWDAQSGELMRTYTDHKGWVNAVAISLDGKMLASGSADKTICLWDIEMEQTGGVYLVKRKVLTGHLNWVNAVAISPDGKTLASGSADKTICLWDVLTGRLKEVITGHSKGVTSVAFSADGKMLASGSVDQAIRLWQIEDGEWQGGWQRLFWGLSNVVWSLTFSPDSQVLASAIANEGVKLWSVEKRGLPQSFSVPGILSVAYSPDGEMLACGGNDKTVKLWNLKTGQLNRTLEGHGNWVSPVAFSPDGKTLASGSGDKAIRLWRIE